MNPFESIDPLSEEVNSIAFAVTLNTEVNSFFVSKNDHDDDSEEGDDETWVNENEEPIMKNPKMKNSLT